MADGFTSEGLTRSEITADEGLMLQTYSDSLGIKTIGIGHNLERQQTPEERDLLLGADNNPNTVTQGEAEQLLDIHLDKTEDFFDRKFPAWRDMPEPAQRAFLNMGMMGTGSFSTFKNMIGAALQGDFAEAGRQALASRWASQVQPSRVERIQSLFRAADLATLRPPRRSRPQIGASSGGGSGTPNLKL